MVVGIVKLYNESKGFGFITPNNGGNDIFVHVSSLIDEIHENDIVSFEPANGKRGLTALNVKVINEIDKEITNNINIYSITNDEFVAYRDILKDFFIFYKKLNSNSSFLLNLMKHGYRSDSLKKLFLVDFRICFSDIVNIDNWKSKQSFIFYTLITDLVMFPNLREYNTIMNHIKNDVYNENSYKTKVNDWTVNSKESSNTITILLQIIFEFDKKLFSEYEILLGYFCILISDIINQPYININFSKYLTFNTKIVLSNKSDNNNSQKNFTYETGKNLNKLHEGIVKYYNEIKGFGLITPFNGVKDIAFISSNLKDKIQININDKVSYELLYGVVPINIIVIISSNLCISNNNNIFFVKRDDFDKYRVILNEFIDFLQKLQKNSFLINHMKSIGHEANTEFINMLCLIDIKIYFNNIDNIANFKSKKCLFLFIFIFDIFSFSKFWDYELINSLIELNGYNEDSYKKAINALIITYNENSEPISLLLQILHNYDKKLFREYTVNIDNLFNFFLCINNQSYTNKIDFNKYIRNNEVLVLPNKIENYNAQKPITLSETITEILTELNNLIGLDAVKNEITTLVNYIQMQKRREELGLKSAPISNHIVFTGNPGTGKTTVARIIAKIYKCLGIISDGHLIETDRSGLIAEYVGQTAIKVNNLVDKAMNGVLFIDEAYSIAGEGNNDFGREAVATLIKRMEDDRNKLVIILAGYTQEMKKFIESNPGIKSRFNKNIEFVDYTANDMVAIFESLCTNHEYHLNESAKTKIIQLFTNAYTTKDKSFGNGRYVRNVFEHTLEKQANRLSDTSDFSKENLSTIIDEDISL